MQGKNSTENTKKSQRRVKNRYFGIRLFLNSSRVETRRRLINIFTNLCCLCLVIVLYIFMDDISSGDVLYTTKIYFLILINDNIRTVTTLSPHLAENTAVCVNKDGRSSAAVALRYGAPFDCSLAVRPTHMYQDQHLDTPSTLVAKLASKRRHDLLKPLKTSGDIMERSVGHGRGSSSDATSQDWRVSRGSCKL